MFADHQDHFGIVARAFAEHRPIDERTYSSAVVLLERIEGLKAASSVFDGLAVSPHMRRLLSRHQVTVG